MKSFKKLTAVFLAVLILASFAVIGVYADETPAAANTSLTVTSTSSLGGEPVSKAFNTAEVSTVTVRFAMTATQAFANIQGFVSYDDSVLEVKNVAFDSKLSGVVYNMELADKFTFNDTHGENVIDYTMETTFLTVTFNILAESGETTVALNVEELNSLTAEYTLDAIISDGATVKADTVAGSVYIDDPVLPTQPAPETKVTVKAAKAKIYVGATTTVTATVTNASDNDTAFSSSNATVVKVIKINGKAATIKGLKAGTATITAKNNGKSASVKITVAKKNNPLKVKAKALTVKAKAKNTTFKKAKAFKITGAKGKVTFKKKSGSKLISVNKKSGAVTVKNGIKKGKTAKATITVTAAGTTAYKKGSKTVTITVKAK
ncbi:MAG: hypothetical protein K6F88_01985 [Ruminococcus sp.]|nr:hypothetical protein [Ruminococcus sp.]